MSKLLIIGNGFDLHCRLDTSYMGFFQYLKSKDGYKEAYLKIFEDDLQKFSGRINIWWALLLSYHDENKIWLWKDIEGIMLSFLLSKTDEYQINLSDILQNYVSYSRTLAEKYNTSNILPTAPSKFKFLFLLDRANNLRDFWSSKRDALGHEKGIIINTIHEMIDILREDLTQIENDFTEYLSKLTREDKNGSGKIANYTYAKLLDIKGKDGIDSERGANLLHEELEKTNVLSFNFTRLGQPSGYDFKYFKNIHGTIENRIYRDIIFGIDSFEIQPDNPIYVFTKTYRTSLLEGKLLQEDTFSGKLRLAEISEIIIYGHSLNRQDYSYYFALFSKVKIDTSETTITLLYSNFNNKDYSQEKCLLLQKLIYDYEILLYGKSTGLYHRMLIEGRIGIKEI